MFDNIRETLLIANESSKHVAKNINLKKKISIVFDDVFHYTCNAEFSTKRRIYCIFYDSPTPINFS